MSAEKGKMTLVVFLLLIGCVCCIAAVTQAGVLVFSSPEIQETIESATVPYEQKMALLYSEAIQQENPVIREYAYLLTAVPDPDGGTLLYACNIWDDLNKNWDVVSDPKGPAYISSSIETIKAGIRGDSGDYSVLMAGLAGSTGAEMRIVSVSGTYENPGHVYPEIYLSDNESDLISKCRYISYRYDCSRVYYSTNVEDGRTVYWLNLDWAAGRNPDESYYFYGDSSAYHELTHPGQSYDEIGKSVVFYYPDGSYKAGNPGYGYYEKDVFGRDTLNVL